MMSPTTPGVDGDASSSSKKKKKKKMKEDANSEPEAVQVRSTEAVSTSAP